MNSSAQRSKAHVWWTSPGCDVKVASLRLGLFSSRAGWWIWPAYTPWETFNHSLVHQVLKRSALMRRKQWFVCDLMGMSSTIWKMTVGLSSSGNPGNGRCCWSAQSSRKKEEQDWRGLGRVRSENYFNALRPQELSGSQLWPQALHLPGRHPAPHFWDWFFLN